MYVVGFNGPPRSGKDTLAGLLRDQLDSESDLPIHMRALSMPMRQMAFGAIGRPYSVEDYESLKDTYVIQHMTMREFMIGLSEKFMKPEFGHDIWARLACYSLDKSLPGILLITDIGFRSEVEWLERTYGIKNLCVVQTFRQTCDFAKDSRTYVGTDGFNVGVSNNWGLSELEQEARRLVRLMSDKFGWKI